MVANDIATPTASGALPDERDCLRFMNLCRGRELNPWTGDCFMIGYDSQGGAKFEVITAYQALLKRAERSQEFEGMEGGVVVMSNGQLVNRTGTIVMKGETIIGGWARAYRTDRRVPHESAVMLQVYDTGKSRWSKDPAGMIMKVAKAAVLREAFPNTVGGLYLSEEVDAMSGDMDQMPRIEAPVSSQESAGEEPQSHPETEPQEHPDGESQVDPYQPYRDEIHDSSKEARAIAKKLFGATATAEVDALMLEADAAKKDGMTQRDYRRLQRFAEFHVTQIMT